MANYLTEFINEHSGFNAASTIMAQCPMTAKYVFFLSLNYHRHYFTESELYGKAALTYLTDASKAIVDEIQLELLDKCDLFATIKTSMKKKLYHTVKHGIVPVELELPTDSGGLLAQKLTLYGRDYCKAIAEGFVKGVLKIETFRETSK